MEPEHFMLKLSKEALNKIQSKLGTVDSSWQTEYTLRDTIKECFDLIKEAREKGKISWEVITEIIKQESGIQDGISPASVSKYYLELKNSQGKPSKRKKKSGASKSGKLDSGQSDSSKSDLAFTPSSGNTIAAYLDVPDTNSEKLQESAVEVQESEVIFSEKKPDLQPKRRFGASYESGNRKVSDEFNL